MTMTKKMLCFVLAAVLTLGLFGGCQNEAETINENPLELPDQNMESFDAAVYLGIAWEELDACREEEITFADLIKLFENALQVIGKGEFNEALTNYAGVHRDTAKVKRYELAQLLYIVYNEAIDGHAFTYSASATQYEVGGIYKEAGIWDCPDYAMVEQVGDPEACNFAICVYDRVTSEKLMELYEDFTFRPMEKVTVESAVETVLHFARAFEKDPVYTETTDPKATKHTIDKALYTGETTLPDASNQDLPNWRGFNISYESMFAGALCGFPDSSFIEAHLDYIKELGANYVHLYLSWSYFQGPDHTFDSKVNCSRLEQLDTIISWCMERDIHIQLVFNDVPNLDYNNQTIPGWSGGASTVFTQESVRDTVTAFWRMLSKRYADISNNYLSFNLMNECQPSSNGNYIWAFGDAVEAIWEEAPGRVIVADVHATETSVNGEGMAALGCALSYHFYNLEGISVVSTNTAAMNPGFYQSIEGPFCYANATLYGPDYWDKTLASIAKGALEITGDVGGATLSVEIQDLSGFDTVMNISADGQTLYEGMEPYTYDERYDIIEVDATVTVTIPEDATSLSIGCPSGSAFTMSDLKLTLKDGTNIPFYLLFDYYRGTQLAKITVSADGSFTSTLTLGHIPLFGRTLNDIMRVAKSRGVDVMIGECGFFEGDGNMAIGIKQEAVENLFMEQFAFFEEKDIAWCCEYMGRYTLITPAPYLDGVAYRQIGNSPYYINMEMDAFFRSVFAEFNEET